MKGLTAYELEGIGQIRKLFAMHYRNGPLTPIEAAEARLLKEYGHPKDEGCEEWHQSELAAEVKYPQWDYSQRMNPRH